MKSNLQTGNLIQVKAMDIQTGRAAVELTLPDCCEDGYFHVCLWDEKGLPVFVCDYPAKEEEPCVIHLLHPHLWEGVEKPYLYRLEVYWGRCRGEVVDAEALPCLELLESRWLALRTLQEISGKGWFLNGIPFCLKCVQYASVGAACGMEEQELWNRLEQRLCSLVKMGANTLVFDSLEGLSERECILLQEHCDRQGLLLQTTKQHASDKEVSLCQGGTLFDKSGLPTDVFYRFKACWSKEPFVYICSQSLSRQPDGGYRVTVYSNRKKVALLINGVVFGFQEDGPEFSFQDIQIKGFPVCFAAEAEECSMSVVCYGARK